MGFYINEEIKTKLHFKDVALISMVIWEHIERYEDTIDSEQKTRMTKLVGRLNKELYINKDNDKPNSH